MTLVESLAEPVARGAPRNSSLVGLTRAGLAEALAAIGVPEREHRMRVAQLWHWIYFQGATSFDDMLNVSKLLRARLAEATRWRGQRSSPSRCRGTARANG